MATSASFVLATTGSRRERPDVRLPEPNPELCAEGGVLSARRLNLLLLFFLCLGLAARGVRFFLRFPLWEDECFLCVNFLNRDMWQVLEPLQYHQVAPPLFLWIELGMVKVFGFSELALRLFPFVCSIASLFIFRHLAGRLLRGLPLLLAFAIFACSYSGARYAAEAKQYASDQLVSLVLLSLAVACWRKPASRSRAWALVLFAPVAIGLSYPSVFVAGGISLFLGGVYWQSQERRGWPVWIAFNGAIILSLGAVFLVTAGNQSSAEIDFMRDCWQRCFPPMSGPVDLVRWFFVTHSSELFAYPMGGANGGSVLTFVCIALGVGVLALRGHYRLMAFLLIPFGLHITAAALQRYPYGGHVKFSQHLSPAICILAGLGVAGLLHARVSRQKLFRLGLAASLAFPAAVGAGCIVRDIMNPYKTRSDMRNRAFAQWFWHNTQFEGEAICLYSDVGLDYSACYRGLSWSAMYLCNQRIYSPRHAAGLPPRYDQVTAGRPLRCVIFRDPDYPDNEQLINAWLAEMQKRFRLVGRELYALTRFGKNEKDLAKVDHLEILRFEPGNDGPDT
ncbi:MAG: glycosyltransferase family 39 protein [Planctomycetes bacterium]|nr:glycosyltransferase family 39 protein [Planctomycetota bacterium]